MGEAILSVWAQYSSEFVSFGLTLLTGVIYWLVQGRAKVRWGVQHGFAHKLANRVADDGSPMPDVLVYTSAILFINTGRIPAKNVEITLNYKPDSLAVWPDRQYLQQDNPDKRPVVRFESLAPREQLTINLLSVGVAVPDLLTVRAENALPKQIPLGPARMFSKPVQVALIVLLMLGILTAFYALITTVAWFAHIGGSNYG
jgi:hypothetical protein